MNNKSLLAMSVALALVGCGSDNDNNTPELPKTFTVTAIDGYLQNAQVGIVNDLGCDVSTLNERTDNSGQVVLKEEYKNSELCIKAIAGVTVDSSRGLVQDDFELSTTKGSSVINPMNNLVFGLMRESGLSEVEAKERVVSALATETDIELDQSLVFGDYHSDHVVHSTEAQALNLVGEILVDHNSEDVVTQLELTKSVADITIEAIENNHGQLPGGFTPIVNIPGNGNPIETLPNHRPSIDGSLDDMSVELGAAPINIDTSIYFFDEDNDRLFYSVQIVSGVMNNVTIDEDTGLLYGHPTTAGESIYQIFATDEHGARSYPLNFKLTVKTLNTPPQLSDDEFNRIQDQLQGLSLFEGESIDDLIDATNLFFDEDGDELSFTADSTLDSDAFVTNIEDGVVSFVGLLPRAAGAGVEKLVISTTDGVFSPIEAEFSLPEIIEAVEPPPEKPLGFREEHFNNQNWKMGSFADKDGEIGHASLVNRNGDYQFCWGEDDSAYDVYKINISHYNPEQALERLAELDLKDDYLTTSNRDCWPVELRDGILYSSDGDGEMEYEVLYENPNSVKGYQLLVKIDGDELFWLDSTNTPFANVLTASSKVFGGAIEYDMTVEAMGSGGSDPSLYYAAGEYLYHHGGRFNNTSILPEGFYTDGDWVIETDSNNRDVVKVLEDQEDQKTRYRYVHRDFGDFYLSIKWSRSNPEFGLFSTSKNSIMSLLIGNVPIMDMDD